MQPVFSAINDAHRSHGLPPPALDDHLLSRTRQGLRRAQAEVETRDSRTPLPAEAAIRVLEDGEATSVLQHQRDDSAIVLAAIFAGRQDSAVHLRPSDISISDTEIWLRLSEKGKKGQAIRRIVRLPLGQSPVAGHPSALPRVAALLRRYLDVRTEALHGAPEPEFAFQLPGEVRPTTASMERWLDRALRRCGVAAPAGFAYQGHSLRSLGASAMAAIGVERHIYIWLGGWARGSSVVDRCYIDPTFMPSPAAYALYGWALSRQYSAGAAEVVRATCLPDPRVMQPAAVAPPPTLPDVTPAHIRLARRLGSRYGY